ncbi:MAG: deoxyguanosinetriphosphate triphosphohydrolase [Chloroflexi bacterium]|jgi:dGTPase|uniref:Deoxyguanosinetriphosphate triphosphohydrolase-like protein n=1 Tax=Candidatus Thermofonsia Clade 3 bacterium TaxID=2364212 RepID=A0A2M8QGH7_9CHLR|nr:deoxyguanosinetriphosphate triphosphohydrolase [Candidatus Roseilinea sp. NK_OTU-006]PJF48878.1 MAG: deoxyguanosinetriphosphate triphosphohydrolase [Candidatus Thermofonsia Clade 3 bacterium]RMG66040.1 MAG: deoxyguanosinetriphosphate triphosphohydrolase [Chloroflexota bacterium]
MRTREELERIEALTLAPYAMKSAASRGRQHPEPEAAYRTAFQRDRERILHTTAFRRLQGKTQVFVTTEGDYYRTRITHTLEVAQIGRTIARALGANEDLVEGICLAHDLGHPPFGHSGERALNALMASEGGFDHNRQSFRIITELERRYPDFPGLNLTHEFREGILKHNADALPIEAPPDYWPELHGTLEAQIAAVVDELAYNAHDLDDALRAGLVGEADVKALAWWQRAREAAQVDDAAAFTDVKRHRIIRRLIDLVATELLVESSRRIEALLAQRGSQAGVDDVRRWPTLLVAYSDEAERMNQELKRFLNERVYAHPHVLRMARQAEHIVNDLFQAYTREPHIMPESARQQIERLSLSRAVCDYIAGMTDRFALAEHARLLDSGRRV